MNLVEQLRATWLVTIIGVLLYIAGLSILFWNEVRTFFEA